MSRFSETIQDLQERNLFRQLRTIAGPQNPIVLHDEREYINFSSNNYLGLANHPKMIEAAVTAAQTFGTGSGASRLITGSMRLHEELETRTAAFKGTEAALLFNSGFQANACVIPAITAEDDVIFSDELNHASLIDGCRLSAARKIVYPHCNMERLADFLKKESQHRKKGSEFWIITDTVFSMDGDLCPLPRLKELAARYEAYLYVDDAHGTGVYGETGSGCLESSGIAKNDESIIQLMTFSKALGSFGACICASRDIITFLINKARGFIYSTSLPPGIAGTNLKALELAPQMVAERKRLWHNIYLLKTVIEAIFEDHDDMRIAHSQSPILPIIFGTEKMAMLCADHFFAHGIWAQAIRPPTVAAGSSRIRLTVTSSHSSNQVYKLLACLESLELQASP